MSEGRLVVGLPAGSLADPSRGGNVTQLLEKAGFYTHGYDTGGPSSFPLTPFIVGWDGRPQEFGAQLDLLEIDLAIAGDDWIQERVLECHYEYEQEVRLHKVLSLERGSVRVVVINDEPERGCDAWLSDLLAAKTLITVVAEMPYLSLDWFRRKAVELGFGDTHGGWSVQKFKTRPKVESGLVIYETWGKTEAKVKNRAADFGVEVTQTGSAIRNYGLNIAAEIMTSEAGVWANPRLKEDAAKYDLARMFLLNLYGAVFAENKVMLSYNVRNADVPGVLEYLRRHKLFADEPTMTVGETYTEFNSEMRADAADLPLAKARYELAKLGATAIDTIPLESSIPSLDVIDF